MESNYKNEFFMQRSLNSENRMLFWILPVFIANFDMIRILGSTKIQNKDILIGRWKKNLVQSGH